MNKLEGRSTSLVKNPLTVIAVFAGLAEVCATIALPQLNENVQAVFVWFVMLFPTLLVSFFFGTLWRNHKVLYAPSDFQDEKNWMSSLIPPSSVSQPLVDISDEDESDMLSAGTKISQNLDVSTNLDVIENGGNVPDPHGGEIGINRNRQARLAEDLVFSEIQRELNVYFKRQVAFESAPNIRFDGVAEVNGRAVFLEIVSVFNNSYVRSVFARLLERISFVENIIPQDARSSARFILAVVLHSETTPQRRDEIKSELLLQMRGRKLEYDLRVFEATSLRASESK